MRPDYGAVLNRCSGFEAVSARSALSVQPRYTPVERLVGPDFFEHWNFYSGPDPTHGTVEFVTEMEAWNNKLLSASPGGVYMGVDNTTKLGSEGGRKAVRIESKKSYNGGMFVLTLKHVPTACGAWPAFWMFGDDAQHAWPRWGEYDILESIHVENYATTTLHTRASCDQREVNNGIDFVGQGWAAGSTGTNKAKNCWVKAPQEYDNQGCGQKLPAGSFGPDFNKNQGGTFVAEWDNVRKFMRTWFFPSGKEPIDLLVRGPQPDMWGTPNSYFTLNERWCTADHFKNMRMVFDTTFCGDYAGSTFKPMCPWLQTSCEDYVRNNPEAFSDAFWSIKTLDVYQKVDAATLAAQAPVMVSDATGGDIDGAPNNNKTGLVSLFVLAALAGAFVFLYYRNASVKSRVDEYTGRVQQLWLNWRDEESEEESPKKAAVASPKDDRGRGGIARNLARGMEQPSLSRSPSPSRPSVPQQMMAAVKSIGSVVRTPSRPSPASKDASGGFVARAPTGGSFQRVAAGGSPSGSLRLQHTAGSPSGSLRLQQPVEPQQRTIYYSHSLSRDLSGAIPQPPITSQNSNSLPISQQGSIHSRGSYPGQAFNSGSSLPPTMHYLQAVPRLGWVDLGLRARLSWMLLDAPGSLTTVLVPEPWS
ncbi:unnamed protein product [Symbiodinium sp. CCMP2456]|nr:unnamed protein product [Symbiodinium sp. CCMP2456]